MITPHRTWINSIAHCILDSTFRRTSSWRGSRTQQTCSQIERPLKRALPPWPCSLNPENQCDWIYSTLLAGSACCETDFPFSSAVLFKTWKWVVLHGGLCGRTIPQDREEKTTMASSCTMKQMTRIRRDKDEAGGGSYRHDGMGALLPLTLRLARGQLTSS